MEPTKYAKGKHQYTKWGKTTEVKTVPQQPTDPAPQVQLQVDTDEATAQGVYANLAGVTHTDTEFILDFLFVQPHAPKARLRARVISSPLHTKRFLAALADNVRKFEERFGPLDDKTKYGKYEKA